MRYIMEMECGLGVLQIANASNRDYNTNVRPSSHKKFSISIPYLMLSFLYYPHNNNSFSDFMESLNTPLLLEAGSREKVNLLSVAISSYSKESEWSQIHIYRDIMIPKNTHQNQIGYGYYREDDP